MSWHHITDLTRWQRKPLTFNNLETAVEHTRRTYRRAVWYGLDRRVFVVLEKEALASVVGAVTEEYDVPLLVTKGFSSLTFAHSVAEDIKLVLQWRNQDVRVRTGRLGPERNQGAQGIQEPAGSSGAKSTTRPTSSFSRGSR